MKQFESMKGFYVQNCPYYRMGNPGITPSGYDQQEEFEAATRATSGGRCRCIMLVGELAKVTNE